LFAVVVFALLACTPMLASLGTRLEIAPQIERAAEALVQTEWKILREQSELSSKTQEAFVQAKLYGAESLAGFELLNRRYLVYYV
jgi:hypothetical protein